MLRCYVACAVALVCLAIPGVAPATWSGSSASAGETKPDRVCVEFRNGTSREAALAFASANGLQMVRKRYRKNAYLFLVDSVSVGQREARERTVQSVCDELRAIADIPLPWWAKSVTISAESLTVLFRVPVSQGEADSFATENGLRLIGLASAYECHFALDRSKLPGDATASTMSDYLRTTYPSTVYKAEPVIQYIGVGGEVETKSIEYDTAFVSTETLIMTFQSSVTAAAGDLFTAAHGLRKTRTLSFANTFVFRIDRSTVPDTITASMVAEQLRLSFPEIVENAEPERRFPPSWTSVREYPRPAGAVALACYPNPFNPNVTIQYTIVEPGFVMLNVHDVTGRLIRRVVCGRCSSGSHTAVWDGTDDAGRPVGSGVYLVRLVAPGRVMTRRVMLLR